MPDLSQVIENAASSPQSVTIADQTVTAHSIGDLIQADQHLASKEIGEAEAGGRKRSPWNALRPGKAVPPGAV